MRATRILPRHKLHSFHFFRRFVKLAGGEKRICEYNQEACRLNAFDGKKSLIRSFPSKVGVRATAFSNPA